MHKQWSFLLIFCLTFTGCSFWEHDEVVGVNVVGNQLHVMHKKYKGFTPFSLNIHGGSPYTLSTDIFDSSWSITESGDHSLSAKKENDWKEITSVSGTWYPVLYKTPENSFYMAYFNISSEEQYVVRYSTHLNGTKEIKFNFSCKPVDKNPCFAMDRYANRFFAAGSLYVASNFSAERTLESKTGYLKFVTSINKGRLPHLPLLVKLSSDGLYLFYFPIIEKNKNIFTYNIKSDLVGEIKLDQLDIKSKGDVRIEDIDSHKGAVQVLFETQKSKRENCDSPCSSSFNPVYSIYDATQKKHYPIPIKNFYYGITETFWDIKNRKLYALTGKRMGDIDHLEVFNYADKSTRTLNLNHLIH